MRCARSRGNRPAQPPVVHGAPPRCAGRPRGARCRGAWFRLRAVRASAKSARGSATAAVASADRFEMRRAGVADALLPHSSAASDARRRSSPFARSPCRRSPPFARSPALPSGVAAPRSRAAIARAQRASRPAIAATPPRPSPAAERPDAPSSSTGSCSATSRCSAASRRSRRAPISKRRAKRAMPRLARRATEIALRARQRDAGAGSRASCGASSIRTAERPKQVIAALASGRWARSARAAGDAISRRELERAARRSGAQRQAALGEAFLQLNRALAQQTDKRRRSSSSQRLAKPYPDMRRGAVRRRARRVQHRARDDPTIDRGRDAGDRPRAGAEARLGPRGAAQGRDPRQAVARRRRSTTCSDVHRARIPTPSPRAGALAQLYVEQKRYAEARAIFAAAAGTPTRRRASSSSASRRSSLQMKDWASAERLFEDLKKRRATATTASSSSTSRRSPRRPKRYDEAIDALQGGAGRRARLARASCASPR